MRRIAVFFIAFCAAVAQDDPRARARELERQAEKALDEGRRADALKLLADAADLRDKARGERTPLPAAPKGDAKAEAGPADPVQVALGELDAAIGRGDAAAARKAAGEARERLLAWQRDLEARERKLAETRASTPVERRLDDLERQVRELKEIAGRR